MGALSQSHRHLVEALPSTCLCECRQELCGRSVVCKLGQELAPRFVLLPLLGGCDVERVTESEALDKQCPCDLLAFFETEHLPLCQRQHL